MCTCPPKLTINPYSGCDHGCVYCYASSYVPSFSECRPKKDILSVLKREAAKLKGEIVSISNSSDPYPRMEANVGLTRKCLEVLTESNCRIQIVTKSNLVTRDDDLLEKASSGVELTITTDDENLAGLLEPKAPSPSERLRAAQDLLAKGIPVSVRIDPIIPFVNEYPRKLIATLGRHRRRPYHKFYLQAQTRQLAPAQPSSSWSSGQTKDSIFPARRAYGRKHVTVQGLAIATAHDDTRFSR